MKKYFWFIVFCENKIWLYENYYSALLTKSKPEKRMTEREIRRRQRQSQEKRKKEREEIQINIRTCIGTEKEMEREKERMMETENGSYGTDNKAYL